MNSKHHIIWYWPGKVNPREFRFRPWAFLVLILVPIISTAVFIAGVIFFVSFSTKMDELLSLRAENTTLRSQLGRVDEMEKQLTELEKFQEQVRRGLTEGADLQRIMEAGEAVEWERPASNLPESDWLSTEDEAEPEPGNPLDLLSLNTHNGGFQLPDQWPLDGFITRGFDVSQIDPGSSHMGIDIAAQRGTPVAAVAPGTVIAADWTTRYGYRVIIDHGGGMLSMYGHNELLLVEPGDRVDAGTPIALSGNSGISTAPHLHLEIWLDGRAVDPRALLPKRGEHDEEG